jgi:hypothetical protein
MFRENNARSTCERVPEVVRPACTALRLDLRGDRREDYVLDFEVQPLSRRCVETQRELTAGETFYSVLVTRDGQVTRQDFCAEAWRGPPPEALGWWTAQVPDYRSRRIHWAPQDVMLHYFEELEADRQQEDVRYVLALLLIRRKLLRLEDTISDDEGREVMSLSCSRNQSHYRAVVAVPAAERVAVIQQQLAELLFAKTE